MAIRKINPTSPGQRGMTKSDYQEITTMTPEKSLLTPIKKTSGRNNTGRITCRHKGGGVKQAYRIIDFKREKYGIPATVKTIIASFRIADDLKYAYFASSVGWSAGATPLNRYDIENPEKAATFLTDTYDLETWTQA